MSTACTTLVPIVRIMRRFTLADYRVRVISSKVASRQLKKAREFVKSVMEVLPHD